MSHNPLLLLAACLVKTNNIPSNYSIVFPWRWQIAQNTISLADMGSKPIAGNTAAYRRTSVQVSLWGAVGCDVDSDARSLLVSACRMSGGSHERARLISVTESQGVITSKDTNDETALARSTFVIEVVSSDE